MKIAVIGSGFAGLAVTWHLLQLTEGEYSVDIFDPLPLGAGTSGISPGLLHQFHGKKGERQPYSFEALKETNNLLTAASKKLGRSVVNSIGILRPALNPQQAIDFKNTIKENSCDTEWWDSEKCIQHFPGLILDSSLGGMFIKKGLTINSVDYLEGLWQSCAFLGAQSYEEEITNLSDFDGLYDHVVIAAGNNVTKFSAFNDLTVTPIKGQVIEVEWPLNATPLPFALIGTKYITPSNDKTTCVIGATFERNFENLEVDETSAKKILLEDITKWFPPASKGEIIDIRCGCRAYTPNRMPVVGLVNNNTWCISGLGSKGLLYHAWLGKKIAQSIIANDISFIPQELIAKNSTAPTIDDVE